MSNGTTTKVKTKTSTVVAILVIGGLALAAGFVLGNFVKPLTVYPTNTPTNTNTGTTNTNVAPAPSAVTSAPITISPTGVTINCTGVASTCRSLTCGQLPTSCLCDRTNAQPVPDLVVTAIQPKPAERKVSITVRNNGMANVPRDTVVSVKLETGSATAPSLIGSAGTPTGLPRGTGVTLDVAYSFPSATTIPWLRATVDPDNIINEYGWTGGEFPECLNGEDNTKIRPAEEIPL